MSDVRRRRHDRGSMRLITACVATIVGGAGLAALAPAAQAAPVGVTVAYTCPFPLIGNQTVRADYRADVPETATTSQPITVTNLSAVLHLSEATTQGLTLVGAATIDGSSRQVLDLTGADTAELDVASTIPSTPVPVSGAFDVPVAGVDTAFAASTPGTATLRAGTLTLTLTPRTASGAPTGLGTFDSRCTQQPGQDPRLSSTAVTAPNRPPVATDDTVTTAAGTAVTVPAPGVLANDDDPEHQALSAVAVDTTGTAGQVTLNPDGSYTYVPAAGFSGVDVFTYRASDGALTSAPASVMVTVTPPPVTGPARADLAVAVTAPATAPINSRFPITLTVRNAGPSTASPVTAALVLPLGLRISDAGGGTSSGHVVSFGLPALAAGATHSFTVTAVASEPAGPRVISGAALSTRTRDPAYANNVAAAVTRVR